ncbi:hypothetical protein Tsubulata_005473 [Turnera subulata]|uniref:Bifunctional inhibitor/plant lipid transfer protein/seed storage helical domain-containing protein n=1 Tax=Turnera subulata TaxID=218843 RepID=A0A9Q0FRU9_9ROSI|nr:hypothetical protein Tsubulata_005473 [Turnera subulata]
MASFSKAAALFALLLVFVASVSAFRTTITTVEIDEPNHQTRTEKCRRQVRWEEFRQCEQFLSQAGRRSVLAMRGEEENPRGEEYQQIQQFCCQPFRQLDEDCQCEAFEAIFREQQQRQRGSRGFEQVARQLQSQCGLPQQCQFRPLF